MASGALARRTRIAWLAGVACACGGAPGEGGPAGETPAEHVFFGREVFGAPPAPDFELVDQDGGTFRLSDERGRPVLLFFGFVSCPDVCPTVLSTWTRVARLLGERARDVTFALVTVDPERDTPERLAKHMAVWGPGFVGLTGTRARLEPVYADYHVRVERIPAEEQGAGYLVDHSATMMLVDGEGRRRVEYDFRARAEDVAADLAWLLGR